MSKFSVVLACYNAEKYLKQSIDSILNQSFRDFELIIVDDGSTDKSGILLNDYICRKDNKDINCTFHFLKNNSGTANARNEAISLAKSDWIVIQDADDISRLDRLEILNKYMESEQLFNFGSYEMVDRKAIVNKCDIISAGYNYIDENGVKTGTYRPQFPQGYIEFVLPVHNYVTDTCSCFRKSKFLEVGGYDEKNFPINALDYDLWLRMVQNGSSIYMISEPLSNVTIWSGSSTKSKMEELNRCRLLARYLYAKRNLEKLMKIEDIR